MRGIPLSEAAVADIVVLAVKPHQIDGVLEELSSRIEVRGNVPLVVSIAAGTPIAQLEAACPRGPPSSA